MLTIEEIKKALDAGEIVYLGRDVRGRALNELYLSELEKLEVGYININENGLRDGVYIKDGSGHVRNSCYFIPKEELKYFCIKHPTPTFDDLIDVAVQAYKDGIADEIILNDDISVSTQERTYGVSKTDTNGFEVAITIEKINSLYTETFVIESEEDEKKIQPPVKSIILANGQEIIGEESLSLLKDGLHLKAGAHGNIKIPFALLKGSTVTQKRGAL